MVKRLLILSAALLLPMSLHGGEATTCQEACLQVLQTTCVYCPWRSCAGYHEGQGQCCECSLEGVTPNACY